MRVKLHLHQNDPQDLNEKEFLHLQGTVFYFLLIRPQQKKQKEHKILLEAIKKGDEILTSGGIIAKVTKAEGEKLNVDIAPNVNVVVYRSTVADVINKK